jgi:hypothetical protein
MRMADRRVGQGMKKLWGRFGAVVRAWLMLAVLAGFWCLTKFVSVEPPVLSADAPATQFSAHRAYDTLGRILGREKPHPASSAENAAVRARILAEFAKLGVPARTYTALGCNTVRRFGILTCATVTDIIADVVPGEGKAIVMMAHMDSVPAGPGAADDGSGVATVLETVRALKARGGTSLHPVMALITDGEEFGLLGAAAFLENAAYRAKVGVAINVEARGNRGPSRLFQTSSGDGPLIDLYARSVSSYETSSLYAEIYRFLPNDTDLTLFIREGITSFNFAFVGGFADYHTSLDRRANLSLQTLQQHGENLLGVTASLEQTPYVQLSGANDVYMSIMGAVLPRMPASWALPLSLVCFGFLTLAAFLARGGPVSWGAGWASIAMPPLLLIGAVLVGWGLHALAQIVSGMPDPSNAYPMAMRISLGLGTWGVVLAVSRLADGRTPVVSAWLWYAVFAIATAVFLPGMSPYFLFPALVAAVLLLVTSRLPNSWTAWPGEAAVYGAALLPLVIWMGLCAATETIMGLKLHPLFTVTAGFAAITLLPVLSAHPMPKLAWQISLGLTFAGAVIAAVTAALQQAYSPSQPQRLNITYVEDNLKGRALWAADATAPLPGGLRAAADFSSEPEVPYAFARGEAYVAQAGTPKLPAPQVDVSVKPPDGTYHDVTLTLHGSDAADQMFVVIPKGGEVASITLMGKSIEVPPEWNDLERSIVACLSRDCRGATITLKMASPKAVPLVVAEQRFGLPDFGAKLKAARPDTAVPSQTGDATILVTKAPVPGW